MSIKFLSFIILSCILLIGCNKHDSSIDVDSDVINLDMPATALTAKYSMDAITARVMMEGPNYHLVSISSYDVTSNGLAKNWAFTFVSTADTILYLQKIVYLRSSNDSVQFDSVHTGRLVGCVSLSKKWINSDIAVQIAEKNGGIQFKKLHPMYTITASLGQGWGIAGVDEHPSWIISYMSNPDSYIYSSMRIDAVNGKILSSSTQ